jgi:hypothetical protein
MKELDVGLWVYSAIAIENGEDRKLPGGELSRWWWKELKVKDGEDGSCYAWVCVQLEPSLH